MSTKYIKVAVSERKPTQNETYMTSHGWFDWYNGKFYNDEDEEIPYVNYWLEEVPDNEADLRKENEEMRKMLKTLLPMFTELDSEFGIENPPPRKWTKEEINTVQKISEFLNKVK